MSIKNIFNTQISTNIKERVLLYYYRVSAEFLKINLRQFMIELHK